MIPSSGQNGLSRLVSLTSRPWTVTVAEPDEGMAIFGGTRTIVAANGGPLALPAQRFPRVNSVVMPLIGGSFGGRGPCRTAPFTGA